MVENLAVLPHSLWQRYHLQGERGHDTPLQKVTAPVPGSRAAEAAIRGDAAALAAMPAAELAAADASGNTPLVWAADAGQGAAVASLLGVDAVDVNARGYLGATAVARASQKGHVAVLRTLCEAGADLDVPNTKMQYPLHFAASEAWGEAAARLPHGVARG